MSLVRGREGGIEEIVVNAAEDLRISGDDSIDGRIESPSDPSAS
jgi:hypothetical protein